MTMNIWLILYLISCLTMIGIIASKRDEIIISLSTNKELKSFFQSFKKEENAYTVIFSIYVILSPIWLLILFAESQKK